MSSPIKVRDLDTNEHDAREYAIIPMYIADKGGKTALIRREFHIINNLSAKILVGINIIKPEGIILDTNRDLAIINSYGSLEIPISIITKGPRTDTVVISKVRYAIPAHSFLTIPIEPLNNLP